MEVTINSDGITLISSGGKTQFTGAGDIVSVYEGGGGKAYVTTFTGLIRIDPADIKKYNGSESNLPVVTTLVIAIEALIKAPMEITGPTSPG